MKRFLSLILAVCIACSLCFASLLSASASTIVGYGEDELLDWALDFLYGKISSRDVSLNGDYLIYGYESVTGDNYKQIEITAIYFRDDCTFEIVNGNGVDTLTLSSGKGYYDTLTYYLKTDDVSTSYYQYYDWGSRSYSSYFLTYNTSSNYLIQCGTASNNLHYNYNNYVVGTGILKYCDSITKIAEYDSDPEPTEPPTTKPVDEEQLEVSNNILENIKTVVTNIINLPAKIADAIGGFFTSLGETLLNGLEYLFVPSDNLFEDLINLLHEKFEFVFQILEIGDFIIDYDFDDSPPDASVDFSGKKGLNWGSGKIQFINWEMIEPYRDLIKNLTIAIAWYFFIRKVQKRLPDIINGVSSGGND